MSSHIPRSRIVKLHPKAEEARARIPMIIDSINPNDLIQAIKRAPSLRGMILGYIAEEMFARHVLSDKRFSDVRKHDDHDRTLNKADRDFMYKGKRFSIQLKSVQTNTIGWNEDLGCLTAKVQNDGSDKRDVQLPNGEVVSTTNYRIGDYDIMAVPLFPFTGEWNFAYLKNSDCRLTESAKYTESQRRYLLATTEKLYFPLREKWRGGLIEVLEELL